MVIWRGYTFHGGYDDKSIKQDSRNDPHVRETETIEQLGIKREVSYVRQMDCDLALERSQWGSSHSLVTMLTTNQ